MRTKDLCLCALFTALTAILAQFTIPLPLGVPLTLQTFAVTLAGLLLGAKMGAISMALYVALGMIGLPVFNGFQGGLQIVAGPTGGFILSFPLMAFIAGFVSQRTKRFGYLLMGCLAGSCANYLFGMIYFSFVNHVTLPYAFTACVLPFIPTGVLKTFLAATFGLRVHKAVQQYS